MPLAGFSASFAGSSATGAQDLSGGNSSLMFGAGSSPALYFGAGLLVGAFAVWLMLKS